MFITLINLVIKLDIKVGNENLYHQNVAKDNLLEMPTISCY